MPPQTLAIDYAARGLAVLMGSQYFFSIFATKRASARFLSLPPTSLSDDQTLFFPALGGRNGAMGLAILILSLQGDRWAAGVLYACCTVIGFSDLYVCSRVKSGYRVHVFGTIVLGAIGLGLLRTG